MSTKKGLHIWQSDAHYVEMRDRTLDNTEKEREKERERKRERETAIWSDGPSRYNSNNNWTMQKGLVY